LIDRAPRTILRLRDDVTLRVAAKGLVQVRHESKTILLPLFAIAILERFFDGATVDGALAQIPAGNSRREIERLVRDLASAGILETFDPKRATGSAVPSLGSVFKPISTNDSPRLARIGAGLANGELCVIENAFDESFAESVHGALLGTESWTPAERAERVLGHRYHRLSDAMPEPEPVAVCRRMFDSRASKATIARLSGLECFGGVQFSGTLFLPGDFLNPHDDANAPRAVAYVWNLSKEWDPRWGGHFFWCNPVMSVFPAFNTLLLFRVISGRSYHAVPPVQAIARGRRVAVSGWWTSSGAATYES
jgi:Rps23 Pro-64 3,4-dihydroxylase Tpa1-like proline 4-hydroxylase